MRYPSSTTDLEAAGIRVSGGVYDTGGNNFYYCTNTSTNEYAVGARTPSNASAYQLTTQGGIQKVAGVSWTQTYTVIGMTSATTPGYCNSGHVGGSGWATWTNAN